MKRWHGTVILIYRSISRPESLTLWVSSTWMTQLTWTFVRKKKGSMRDLSRNCTSCRSREDRCAWTGGGGFSRVKPAMQVPKDLKLCRFLVYGATKVSLDGQRKTCVQKYINFMKIITEWNGCFFLSCE